MRKLFILVSCFLYVVKGAAQKDNFLALSGQADIPVGVFGDLYKMGYGGQLKFLHQITNDDCVTLTSGISFFTIKLRYTTNDETQTYRVIPVMAGFRRYYHSVYVEPAAGLGFYQLRHELKDQMMVKWHSAFTGAFRMGYVKDQYEMAIRYQSGLKKDDNISFVSLIAGYHFRLGKKK